MQTVGTPHTFNSPRIFSMGVVCMLAFQHLNYCGTLSVVSSCAETLYQGWLAGRASGTTLWEAN